MANKKSTQKEESSELEIHRILKNGEGDLKKLWAEVEACPSCLNAENKLDGGRTPLHYSLLTKNTKVTFGLVEALKEIGTSFPSDIFCVAVESECSVDVFDALMNAADDVMSRNKEGKTGLMVAALMGRTDIIAHMAKTKLKGGAGLADPDGQTALHFACKGGTVSSVEQLLRLPSVKLECQDSSGLTPFHIAAGVGNIEVMEFLKKKGAKHMSRDLNGETPLHDAARVGSLRAVQLLIKWGCPVDVVDDAGNTPLVYAATEKSNGIRLLKFLIDSGASPIHKDNNNSTVLHAAAENGNRAAAILLIENGAKVNARDKDGMSALCCAARYGEVETGRELIRLGANVNIQGYMGWTALHEAARRGYVDFIKLLGSSGANLDLQCTKWNSTALSYAAFEGAAAACKVLLALGADPAIVDKFKKAPSHWARSRKHNAIYNILRKAENGTLKPDDVAEAKKPAAKKVDKASKQNTSNAPQTPIKASKSPSKASKTPEKSSNEQLKTAEKSTTKKEKEVSLKETTEKTVVSGQTAPLSRFSPVSSEELSKKIDEKKTGLLTKNMFIAVTDSAIVRPSQVLHTPRSSSARAASLTRDNNEDFALGTQTSAKNSVLGKSSAAKADSSNQETLEPSTAMTQTSAKDSVLGKRPAPSNNSAGCFSLYVSNNDMAGWLDNIGVKQANAVAKVFISNDITMNVLVSLRSSPLDEMRSVLHEMRKDLVSTILSYGEAIAMYNDLASE